MTVQDVLNALFRLASPELKEDWDNVGLLCGKRNCVVKKAMIALDPTLDVLKEAADYSCDLLITHHPILFGTISELSDDTPTGRALLFAVEHGINCINLHTNLDCVSGGVNDVLAARFGLQNVRLLHPRGSDENGEEYGYVRCGVVSPTSVRDFLNFVKKQLGCTALRYVDGGKPVYRVAVGGGACADELQAVAASGCDTFVTADVKYHQFSDAAAMGLTLIDAGHFQTENPICDVIFRYLSTALPMLECKISERHTDVIGFC